MAVLGHEERCIFHLLCIDVLENLLLGPQVGGYLFELVEERMIVFDQDLRIILLALQVRAQNHQVLQQPRPILIREPPSHPERLLRRLIVRLLDLIDLEVCHIRTWRIVLREFSIERPRGKAHSAYVVLWLVSEGALIALPTGVLIKFLQLEALFHRRVNVVWMLAVCHLGNF